MNIDLINFNDIQISFKNDKKHSYVCQHCTESDNTYYLASYGQWVCHSCISEMIDIGELAWCRTLKRPASRYKNLCRCNHKCPHGEFDLVEHMEKFFKIESLDDVSDCYLHKE